MSRIVIAGGHLAVWIASLLLLGVDAVMGVVLHIPRKASVAYARAIWLYAAEILPVPVAVRTRYRRWLEDWDAVEAPMAAAPGWVRQVVLRNTEALRMVWSRTTKQWGVSPS